MLSWFAPLINSLIDLIHIIAMFAIYLLPESPFQFEPLEWGAFGKLVGMFIPIEQIGIHMTVILSAFLTYYSVRWLLRLVKQIS